MAIVRGLAGLILGIGYGLLAGALIFLWVSLTSDGPGPMIPDNYGWGRMVAMYTALMTGACGALVGLVVGLLGVGKARGGTIGGVAGLVIVISFLLSSLSGLSGFSRLSWPLWKEFLSVCLFFILVFPVGLMLTGVVVSVVARKLKV